MNWLMIIGMWGVALPLMAIGFYGMYRANKEEREKEMQAKNA